MRDTQPSTPCLIVSGNMVEATDLADILRSERGWESTVVQQHGEVLSMLDSPTLEPRLAIVSDDMNGLAELVTTRLVDRGARVILLNGKADATRAGIRVIVRPFGTYDVVEALNQLT